MRLRAPRRRELLTALVVLGCVALVRPDAPTVDASGLTARPLAAAPSPSPTSGGVAVPTPAVPDGLPAQVEDLSPYLKQVSCDPVDKPGAIALGRLLQRTYPGTSYSIGRACGADGIASEHYEGRAVDWFVSVRNPDDAARAQAVLDWLFATDAQGHPYANARRLGVMYVIWDDRIWGSYATSSGWRPYNGCAARPDQTWDTICHRDHVHVSLSWSGAAGRTSFWTGEVAPTDYGPCRPADLNWAPPYRSANPQPCPAYPAATAPAGASAQLVTLTRFSGATIGPQSQGPVVRAVQQALGVGSDGVYGPVTSAAVTALQRSSGLPATGRMDADTWRALLARLAAAPTTPATPTSTTPATPSTPSNPSTPGPTSAPPSTTPSTPARPSTAAPSIATAPTGTGTFSPLSYGSRGSAVVTLQKALGVQPASGWFGPKTWAAVAALQRARGLPVTGVVDAATWRTVLRG